MVARADRDYRTISPSFTNLLYRLFADLQMSAHFRILLQPCSSLGIISTATFFFKKSAVKDGADLKNVRHVLSCTYKTVVLDGQLTIAFVKGQCVTCAKTLSSAS